jgi:2,3-bisphosphoglycerate-independent phosphoglycerate mutase
MVLGEGTTSEDPVQTIKDSYAQGGGKDGDEFLKPIIVGGDERRIKGMSIIPSPPSLVLF